MKKRKALCIRMDKLGDLVLSLPLDQARELEEYTCHWFVTKGLGFVPEHALPARAFTEFQKEFSLTTFKDFVRATRALKPELALILHAPWWVGLALLIARVPQRIGRLSQWHSFFFFNKGVRQSRKHGQCHESDFNLQLLQKGLNKVFASKLPALKLISKLNPEKRFGLEPKKFMIVHPGMGGSALNWSAGNYHQLIEKLLPHTHVAITGTKGDFDFLTSLQDLRERNRVHWLVDQLSGAELIALCQKASCVLAPSTGVVHIAASTDTPTIGIYSPIQVESQVRWGPRGESVEVLEPTDNYQSFYAESIMDKITVEQVYQRVCEKIK